MDKHDVPFGGVSVLVVGDFNQLTPVKGVSIYGHLKEMQENAYLQLAYMPEDLHAAHNPLWDKFKYLQLTEVMRQQGDKEFADALNALGNYGLPGLSKKHLKVFDSRIVQKTEIPQHAIFLYQANKDVDSHNKEKLKTMPGESFKNKAYHKVEGDELAQKEAAPYLRNIERIDRDKAKQVPESVHLKVGAKYMMTKNTDLSDGLVNGTCGILKKIIYDKDKAYAKLVYMDLFFDDVGRKTREKHLTAGKFKRDSITDKNWTPIECEKVRLDLENHKTWHIVRQNFLLVPAEALTICKIQGETCRAVGLDLSQPLKRSELYVAMSRVTKAEDLYLFGKNSLLERTRYRNWSKEKKEEHVNNILATDEVHLELKRLRKHRKFENKYPFLNDDSYFSKNGESKSIIYHKVASIEDIEPFLSKDKGFQRADIIILACDNYSKNIILEDYVLLKITKHEESSKAIIVFVRKSLEAAVEFLSDNSKCLDPLDIGMMIIRVNQKNIFLCYLANSTNLDVFQKSFQNFFRKLSKIQDIDFKNISDHLFVLGTFNFDLLKSQSLLKKLNESFYISNTFKASTTDAGIQMDWCLSNASKQIVEYSSLPYESYFSVHKPIWLTLYNSIPMDTSS